MLDSVASTDGGFCVDLFERPEGGFGFEHFRSDPEDGGRWTAIGGFSAVLYESLSEAIAAAEAAVSWLAGTEAWAAVVSAHQPPRT